MKRVLLLFLPLLLILVSCNRQSPAATGFDSAKEQLFASSPLQGFQRADEDFVEANFGEPEYLKDSAVYLSQGCEVGLFTVEKDADRAKLEKVIRAYLSRELEAAESLAALYPGEESESRVERLKNAHIGGGNAFVYYLV